MTEPKRALFLWTHKSARSQMIDISGQTSKRLDIYCASRSTR